MTKEKTGHAALESVATVPDEPTLTERAEQLARGGGYDFLYQIERALIDEGYRTAPLFKAPERTRLRAILKAAKS
jgi:hypothetical protein